MQFTCISEPWSNYKAIWIYFQQKQTPDFSKITEPGMLKTILHKCYTAQQKYKTLFQFFPLHDEQKI